MNRSQFLAALLILAALAGLVSGRIRPETGVEASAGPETSSEPAIISGGEAAATNQAGADPDLPAPSPSPSPSPSPVEAPPLLGEKPDLENLDGWLQSDATGLDSFDGRVRIVWFWTFGCYNCKNTIPHLQEIYADWHPQGLEIIGVHAPEFDYEADPTRIAEAAADLGVTWPIALDTGKTNFRSWQGNRRFWPRTFVLDQNGQVRFDRIGEGRYRELADTVAFLIENGP